MQGGEAGIPGPGKCGKMWKLEALLHLGRASEEPDNAAPHPSRLPGPGIMGVDGNTA